MKFIAMLILWAVPAFSAGPDPDMSVSGAKGSYVETATFNGSSTAGTAFILAEAKRMDALLFNNSATAIYIGTTSANIFEPSHSNITNGMPVLASATFKLDGVMSAALYFTCASGTSACNVRVLEGKIR